MATGVVWRVVATIRRVCLRRRGKDYKEPEPRIRELNEEVDKLRGKDYKEPEPPRRADVENAKSGAGYTYSATDDQRGISFANGQGGGQWHTHRKSPAYSRES